MRPTVSGGVTEDLLLSLDETADHLGIKLDTVCKWISERPMPGRTIGRLWEFNRQEVDEWVGSGGANTSSSENEHSKIRRRESQWPDSKN